MNSEVDHRSMTARERGESLRLSAALLLAGQIAYIIVTQFHVDGNANNHRVIFTKYAESESWEAVHLLQFASAAILLAGLFTLFLVLDVRIGLARWAARFGAASAAVTLALYGVLQAVDGIGNKQVDEAWVAAQGAEKAARFASAESMRWLEWGVRSYLDYVLGLALLLLAVVVARKAAIPRAVAYLVGLSGLAYWAQGWVVGEEGFSGTHDTLIVVAWVLSVVWMIWLAVIARRPEAKAAE